uniref:Uncharacterized protein n=1 Tax=Octopus bimaculoides TaxID=37653 RepID=A0A0L8GHE5_OCTBM
MSHCEALEVLNCTLQDIKNNSMVMGRATVLADLSNVASYPQRMITGNMTSSKADEVMHAYKNHTFGDM